MISDSKDVLVTGCAIGGIGYEYCEAFAEQNSHVLAPDIPDCINDMSGLESDNIKTLKFNVLSDEGVTTVVNKIISKRSHIDIMINNAGIGSTDPLAELPLDSIRKAWEINTLGKLRLVQNVAPHMANRRSGRIVNIGSVTGLVPTPWSGPYCSSKAAIHAISHSLRVELRPFGINVILVLSSAIKSNLGKANKESVGEYNDWKLYKGLKDSIAARAVTSQEGKPTDAAVFARYVAKKVSSPKPPKQIVYGSMASFLTMRS